MAHYVKEIWNSLNLLMRTLRSRRALGVSLSVFLIRFVPVRSFLANIIVLSNFKKVIIFSVLFFSFSIANAGWLDISIGWGGWSSGLPEPAKMGLPFEWSSEATRPVVLIIKEAIKYVGLIAILVVSWGGIQFLTSIGNDEKVKHAKQTVIYALVWVLLSVVSYTIVDIVNGLII